MLNSLLCYISYTNFLDLVEKAIIDELFFLHLGIQFIFHMIVHFPDTFSLGRIQIFDFHVMQLCQRIKISKLFVKIFLVFVEKYTLLNSVPSSKLFRSIFEERRVLPLLMLFLLVVSKEFFKADRWHLNKQLVDISEQLTQIVSGQLRSDVGFLLTPLDDIFEHDPVALV